MRLSPPHLRLWKALYYTMEFLEILGDIGWRVGKMVKGVCKGDSWTE